MLRRFGGRVIGDGHGEHAGAAERAVVPAIRSVIVVSVHVGDGLEFAIVLREGTPSFRTVGNHAGLFWFSIYRFSVSNGAPPAVPA